MHWNLLASFLIKPRSDGYGKCLIRLQRSKIVGSDSSCHLNSSFGEVLIPGTSYSGIFCGVTVHLMFLKSVYCNWVGYYSKGKISLTWKSIQNRWPPEVGFAAWSRAFQEPLSWLSTLQTCVPGEEQILHPDLDLSDENLPWSPLCFAASVLVRDEVRRTNVIRKSFLEKYFRAYIELGWPNRIWRSTEQGRVHSM